MARVKYAGIPVNDLIVPALSIGQAEQFDALIGAVSPADGELRTDYTRRLLPMVAAALRRNYPAMSDAEVAADLDFSSFNLAVRAALGITDEGAAKTRGE